MRTRWLTLVATLTLASLAVALLPFGCGGSGKGTPSGDAGAAAPPSGAGAGTPTGSAASPANVPQPLVAPEPQKAVATVNGVPIRQWQVYDIAEANKLNYEAKGQRLPEDKENLLRQAALQMLIDGALMIQAGRAAGLQADPKELDGMWKQLRSRFPTDKDFKAFLDKKKLTEEMARKDADDRLVMQAYVKSVKSGVKVSEEDARKVYEANKDKFKGSEQAHILQILVKSDPNDPPAKRAEARKRIDEAYAKAKAGEDFGKLAKQYSQLPNSAKGGDVGFIPRGSPMIMPKFDEVAFGTPVGQVSPVFETPKGFNVIKVVERKEGTIPPFDEIKTRLTLMLTENEQGRAVRKRIDELRATGKIAILEKDLLPPAELQTGEAKPGPSPKKS